MKRIIEALTITDSPDKDSMFILEDCGLKRPDMKGLTVCLLKNKVDLIENYVCDNVSSSSHAIDLFRDNRENFMTILLSYVDRESYTSILSEQFDNLNALKKHYGIDRREVELPSMDVFSSKNTQVDDSIEQLDGDVLTPPFTSETSQTFYKILQEDNSLEEIINSLPKGSVTSEIIVAVKVALATQNKKEEKPVLTDEQLHKVYSYVDSFGARLIKQAVLKAISGAQTNEQRSRIEGIMIAIGEYLESVLEGVVPYVK